MKLFSTIIIFSIALCSFSMANAQTVASEAECIETSTKVLNHLLAGEYEEVTALFDDKVKASLNTEQLKQVWEGMGQRVGAFQESKGITAEEVQGNQVVTNNLEFEKSTIGLRLAFNSDDQISGFFLVPPK